MTTTEALAVVREALKRIESALNLSDLRARSSTEFYDAAMDSLAEARAALALIEERVDLLNDHNKALAAMNHPLVKRAEKAEAERDNATAALERMRLELVRVDGMVSRYSQSADAVSEDRARWMERYAELEAALREILMTDGLGGASEVMRDIASRALVGEASPQVGDLLVMPHTPGDPVPVGWTVEGDKMWRRADGTEAGRALGGGEE